jgi:hypothetical protein
LLEFDLLVTWSTPDVKLPEICIDDVAAGACAGAAGGGVCANAVVAERRTTHPMIDFMVIAPIA